jgi:hypothetical protein
MPECCFNCTRSHEALLTTQFGTEAWPMTHDRAGAQLRNFLDETIAWAMERDCLDLTAKLVVAGHFVSSLDDEILVRKLENYFTTSQHSDGS